MLIYIELVRKLRQIQSDIIFIETLLSEVRFERKEISEINVKTK
jgi:hypothetical protein